VTLGIADISGVDFFITYCPPPPAPATSTPTPTNTPPNTATPTNTPEPGATDTPTPTATLDTGPACTPDVVSLSLSSLNNLSPVPPLVQADGSQTIQVVVTLRDDCTPANYVANQTVSLSSSRGGTDDIQPPSAITDGNGQAVFTIRSGSMSEWDTGSNAFIPSTFTAHVGGDTLSDTAYGTFACVVGLPGTASLGTQAAWSFNNASGIDRRLEQAIVAWHLPSDPGRYLENLTRGSTPLWILRTYLNPALINGGWSGSAADRTWSTFAVSDLVANFDFSVTGGNDITLTADWVDTGGGSRCTSGPVTVTR
jgi:hypothetical protein